MMIFNEYNLKGIRRKSGKWYFLKDGQFFVFTDKKIEIHDNYGKIRGIFWRSIKYASDGQNEIYEPIFDRSDC